MGRQQINLFITFSLMALAVFGVVSLLTTGDVHEGLINLVLVLGIGVIAVCFINPRVGFYLFLIESVYIDLLKRLCVVYIRQDFQFVYQTLIMPYLAFCALVLGTAIYGFRNGLITKDIKKIFWIACCFFAVSVILNVKSSGFSTGMRTGLAVGGYSLIVPVLFVLFDTKEKLRRAVKIFAIVMIPVALYGMKQRFFGLAEFELTYLETGFSITGKHVLGDIRMGGMARPFSTLSSPHAFGVFSFFAIYMWWEMRNFREHRVLIGITATFFTLTMLFSLQRTGFMYILIGSALYLLLANRRGAIFMAMSLLLILVTTITFSEEIRSQLATIDRLTGADTKAEKQIYGVQTFSDRLTSLTKMKANASNWKLLGEDSESLQEGSKSGAYAHDLYSHDGISGIVNSIGIVGLLGFTMILCYATRKIYSYVYHAKNAAYRPYLRFALAWIIPTVFMGIIGGFGIHVVPINIVFYMSVAFLLLPIFFINQSVHLVSSRSLANEES